MFNRVIFDTETTGKYNFNLPPQHETQPYICQIAFKFKDEGNRLISQASLLIKPEGWRVSPEATEVNGITTEDCEQYGVPIIIALALFNHTCRNAEARIAHNINFDDKMLLREFIRIKKVPIETPKRYCTMQLMTDVCKLPNPKYPRSYKWPNLNEAYKYCFGKDVEGAHDALWDVVSCDEIFDWYLTNKGNPVGATYK